MQIWDKMRFNLLVEFELVSIQTLGDMSLPMQTSGMLHDMYVKFDA